jgi:hypothetical protein|tara:strand:+ start:2127 stop:2312 length:186 start_codon:yes stop_codon:yes gene_type:complete
MIQSGALEMVASAAMNGALDGAKSCKNSVPTWCALRHSLAKRCNHALNMAAFWLAESSILK